jgi:hypothetical protein
LLSHLPLYEIAHLITIDLASHACRFVFTLITPR